jgi:hypothetical protein
MTRVCRFLGVLVLLSIVLQSEGSKLIYRRYEKVNKKKNYVHVVEVFDTLEMPPAHSRNEKELNDFLGRDAYKTDMNCTKLDETEDDGVTTKRATTTTQWTSRRTTTTESTTTTARPTTTTVRTTRTTGKPTTTTTTTTQPTTTTTRFPTIPTTAFRFILNPTTTTQKTSSGWDFWLNPVPQPPTSKPETPENPRGDQSPDSSELAAQHNASVQVTKLPAMPKVPIMVIKESDDLPKTNRTSLFDVDNDSNTQDSPQTTTDTEIVYLESDEKLEDYEVERSNVGDVEYGEDDENYDDEYDEAERKKRLSRRKRKKSITH